MFTRHRQPFANARAATLLLVALLLGAGCSHKSYRDPGAPADESVTERLIGVPAPGNRTPSPIVPNRRLLYPLAVGNRWDYALHFQMVVVTADGPQPPQVTDSGLRAEITGTQQIGERSYFTQSESPLGGVASPPLVQIFPVRQDGSGLFEHDLLTAAPPARASSTVAVHAYLDRVVARPAERAAFARAWDQVAARLAAARRGTLALPSSNPGGPDAGELAMLRYPLFVGQQWLVRADPMFGRVVVGRERIVVPAGAFAAWNVHGVSELYGPNDRVHWWYSSAGLVRFRFHFESDATDEFGNVIGRVVGDEEQELSALHLVDPAAPRALSVGPLTGGQPE